MYQAILGIVLIHKAFRFRIYPSPEQIARMGQWEGALRFLWNVALEQRLMGLARCGDDKRYVTAFDQIKELTELRAELPWLADVPRNVCAQLLVELDKAWQRCFKRLGKRPRWKRKGKGSLGLCEPHPKTWRLDGKTLRFPKLGNIPIVVHRAVEGKPKTCTITYEGSQWFASISCEIEIADPAPRTEPVVGIDRGVANLLADSDGNLIPNPKYLDRTLKRLAHAQRVVSRRKKGSKNREKAKVRVATLHRKVRRQREHTLHTLSARYAKSHGTVVVEDLKIQNMVRSAKGTVDEPGANVSAKSGLNRSILDAGWGQLVSMLRYKLAWSGGNLVEVPAAYSSQTCSACGAVDAASRPSQSVFRCTCCGYSDHADLNASKVLKTRANRSGLPGEGSLLGTRRTRKLKIKLRAARRSTSESPVLQGGG